MRRPSAGGKAARAVTSPEVGPNDGFGLAPRVRVAFARFSVEHGRTSPVGLPSVMARDAGTGGRGGSYAPKDGERHRSSPTPPVALGSAAFPPGIRRWLRAHIDRPPSRVHPAPRQPLGESSLNSHFRRGAAYSMAGHGALEWS